MGQLTNEYIACLKAFYHILFFHYRVQLSLAFVLDMFLLLANIAITGLTFSPTASDLLAYLGRDKVSVLL
jgi:hypothetical protein